MEHTVAGEIERQASLEALYTALDKTRLYPRKQLMIIFSFIDQSLHDGDLPLCDSLLDQIEPSEFSVACALAFLAATLPVRNRLTCRVAYTRRLEQWLLTERLDDVESLLMGLR